MMPSIPQTEDVDTEALLGNALAGYADDVVARLEELVADGFANPT